MPWWVEAVSGPEQRVCAVVLTYNREALLRECLSAIFAQTRRPDCVLVVDNASTSGPPISVCAEFPGVELLSLETNEGSAGGFHACLSAAYQRGGEWIWLMDDDVLPQPEALAALLTKAAELGGDPGFLCSRVVGVNGASMNVPEIDKRPGPNHYPAWETELALGVVRLRQATFVSVLFPRSAVGEAGLPLRDMYIFGEDTEYTLRLTQTRPAYLVGQSVVTHQRVVQAPLDLASESNPARLRYYFYLLRNDLYLARRFVGRRAVLGICFRHLRRLPYLLTLPHGGERAALTLRALLAGLRFRPRPEPLLKDAVSSHPPAPSSTPVL